MTESEFTQSILDMQNPSNRAAKNYSELERIIIIRPEGTSHDIIEIAAYAAQHGDLKNFQRFKEILEKQKKANMLLSDAFKRIILFETAMYVGGAYAIDLKNEEISREMVPKMLKACYPLIDGEDYSAAYASIVEAHKKLNERKIWLEVCGRANSTYLLDLKQVLDFCAPDKYQRKINVGFAGRQIFFSIPETGRYQNEIETNPRFADFKEKWPHLMNPAIGFFYLKSPEDVTYVAQFLDKFARQHIILSHDKVRFSKERTLEEQFKIEKHHADIG